MVEPIEICLADMERYANIIEYKSHKDRCVDSVEYESEMISMDGGGIGYTYLPLWDTQWLPWMSLVCTSVNR